MPKVPALLPEPDESLLKSFESWLIERKKAPSTARLYANIVRRIYGERLTAGSVWSVDDIANSPEAIGAVNSVHKLSAINCLRDFRGVIHRFVGGLAPNEQIGTVADFVRRLSTSPLFCAPGSSAQLPKSVLWACRVLAMKEWRGQMYRGERLLPLEDVPLLHWRLFTPPVPKDPLTGYVGYGGGWTKNQWEPVSQILWAWGGWLPEQMDRAIILPVNPGDPDLAVPSTELRAQLDALLAKGSWPAEYCPPLDFDPKERARLAQENRASNPSWNTSGGNSPLPL